MLKRLVRAMRKVVATFEETIDFLDDKTTTEPKIATPQRPTVEKAICCECGGRMSHPHFSCEEFPKIFCMWFCASRFYQRTGIAIYTLKDELKIVSEGINALVIDPQTKRPMNHPIRKYDEV